MGILKGVPPLLTADLLHVLRSMGHGDVLCIADANFPAAEISTKTTTGKCIVITANIAEVLDAVCTVLPLDFFVDHPARSMSPAHGQVMPLEGTQAAFDMQKVITQHCPEVKLEPISRFDFYEHARRSFAVVRGCADYAHVVDFAADSNTRTTTVCQRVADEGSAGARWTRPQALHLVHDIRILIKTTGLLSWLRGMQWM